MVHNAILVNPANNLVIYGKSTIFATREAGNYDDVIPDNAFKGKKSLYYFVFPERKTLLGKTTIRKIKSLIYS